VNFPTATSPAPERTSAPGSDRDARTRDLVLRDISELGPVTATALAERLGLTSAGVRRHLDQLDADGLITTADVSSARRGRGRPARSYVVTPEGHRQLSTGYGDVATSALQFLSDRFGEDAVADFAHELLADLEKRYAPVVDAAGGDLGDRATALAAALARDGYSASVRPVGPSGLGLQLCQGHCPMHEVAARFPQFCEEETEVFARLLGVHVQRLATLAGGEHVCTTFVPRDKVPLGIPGLRPTAADHPELHDAPPHDAELRDAEQHHDPPHDSTKHDSDQQNHRHDEGNAR